MLIQSTNPTLKKMYKIKIFKNLLAGKLDSLSLAFSDDINSVFHTAVFAISSEIFITDGSSLEQNRHAQSYNQTAECYGLEVLQTRSSGSICLRYSFKLPARTVWNFKWAIYFEGGSAKALLSSWNFQSAELNYLPSNQFGVIQLQTEDVMDFPTELRKWQQHSMIISRPIGSTFIQAPIFLDPRHYPG